VKLLPKGTTCSARAQSVMTTGPFNDEIGQATVGTINANEFSNVIFPVSGEFFLCYTRDVASQTYIELSPIIQVIGSESNVMKFWCSLEIMKQVTEDNKKCATHEIELIGCRCKVQVTGHMETNGSTFVALGYDA
jgi:hypothetical protein